MTKPRRIAVALPSPVAAGPRAYPVRPATQVVVPVTPAPPSATVIFADDFEREVARTISGPNAFGTASDGHVWTTEPEPSYDDSSAAIGGMGVTSGAGYIAVDGSDSFGQRAVAPASGFGDYGHWTLQMKCRFSSSTAGQPSDESVIDIRIGIAQDDIDLRVVLDRNNAIDQLIVHESGEMAATVSFAYDTVYNVKWEHDYPNGVSRAKVWADGDAEPSAWNLEADGVTMAAYDVATDVQFGVADDIEWLFRFGAVGGPAFDDWVKFEVLDLKVIAP